MGAKGLASSLAPSKFPCMGTVEVLEDWNDTACFCRLRRRKTRQPRAQIDKTDKGIATPTAIVIPRVREPAVEIGLGLEVYTNRVAVAV